MQPISGTTRIFGLIADPVAHTLSPLMHNAALDFLGFDGVYVAFHVMPHRLGDAMTGMKSLGIAGLNVTVPHKTAVMRYCDTIDPEAAAVGAVNTLVHAEGGLTGYNTDVFGFRESLRRDAGFETLPGHVCVIGAGGAACGVVYACATSGDVQEMTILNRTVERAVALADEMGGYGTCTVKAGPLDHAESLYAAELIVNTTTMGMHPFIDETPVRDAAIFHSGQVVYDIVYNPVETRFLREAAAAGAATVNGLGMLAWQGARSLSLWTGCDAPGEIMHATLLRHFGI